MLTINRERFLKMMDEQAQIGGTEAGGVSRPAFSENDMAIRTWFKEQIETNGLEYQMDGAGNQSAILRCADVDAKTLLIGSHFDSVPNGGRFDGALGVLAAFEALLTLKGRQQALPFHLEVINFTDEEGSIQGLLGSSALTGRLTQQALRTSRGGTQLQHGMSQLGLSEVSFLNAKRDRASLLGYFEVHIEQGTRLEDARLDIGVVTSIVGIRSYWLTFIGEAAHAGTKPMDKRHDAFWGAAVFAKRARDVVMQDFTPGVVNCGQLEMLPGAFNIVPAQVKLALEFRHGDTKLLNAMQQVLLNLARETADEFNLELERQRLSDIAPAPMSESVVQAIEQAAGTLNLSHQRLLSFAGHDAQSLAHITDSAMFFVPSVEGISHNPAEYTQPDDCINAANVMLHSILALAQRISS